MSAKFYQKFFTFDLYGYPEGNRKLAAMALLTRLEKALLVLESATPSTSAFVEFEKGLLCSFIMILERGLVKPLGIEQGTNYTSNGFNGTCFTVLHSTLDVKLIY